MNFWKTITKTQKRHLKEMGVTTVGQFDQLRERQLEQREKGLTEGLAYGIANPCYECDQIAKRTGRAA